MHEEAAEPGIGVRGFLRGIRGSLVAAAVLLTLDVAIYGSYLFSILSCPVWLLLALVRNAVERPGWGLALARIGSPGLTLGLVLANNDYQLKVAEANARRVIVACEAYQASHDRLPDQLDELVPRYLATVPVAKHCLHGRFIYIPRSSMLFWYVVPPHLRKIYRFDSRTWSYLD